MHAIPLSEFPQPSHPSLTVKLMASMYERIDRAPVWNCCRTHWELITMFRKRIRTHSCAESKLTVLQLTMLSQTKY